MQFRTIDCIVRRDMEIIHVGRHFIIFRDISVAFFFRRSHLYCFAERFRFFQRFLGPSTRIQVSRLLFQEIIGNHTELHACTSTQEQYRVSFRNIQQFLEQCHCFIYHRLEVFSAVTDFHQRKSWTIIIKNSLSCLFYHFARQNRRSRIKIMFLHWKFVLVKQSF